MAVTHLKMSGKRNQVPSGVEPVSMCGSDVDQLRYGASAALWKKSSVYPQYQGMPPPRFFTALDLNDVVSDQSDSNYLSWFEPISLAAFRRHFPTADFIL